MDKLQDAKFYIDGKLKETRFPSRLSLSDEMFNDVQFGYNRQEFARHLRDTALDINKGKYLEIIGNNNDLPLRQKVESYRRRASSILSGKVTFLK